MAELTHNTFRDHLVLEYEIPKYDGDLRNPNFFVPLTQAQFRRKVATVSHHFSSQRGRSCFPDDTFPGCKASVAIPPSEWQRPSTVWRTMHGVFALQN